MHVTWSHTMHLSFSTINSSLLVRFRCLGVQSNLPLYVRSICSCSHRHKDGLGSPWKVFIVITFDPCIFSEIHTFLTLGACTSEGYSSWVCLCVCVCVCLSVCPGKISLYVRLRQSFVVPTVYIWQMLDLKRVDFSTNARVKSYDDKYLSRRS